MIEIYNNHTTENFIRKQVYFFHLYFTKTPQLQKWKSRTVLSYTDIKLRIRAVVCSC